MENERFISTKEKVRMNTPSELCEYIIDLIIDLITKSLEENYETSILHLRKVERYDFMVDDPETGFYYDDDYDVEVQVANLEIYNYSSSLNSVTKYLEEIGCCFEVTYLNHIHRLQCCINIECKGNKLVIFLQELCFIFKISKSVSLVNL
jgi:hypothetical protein